MVSMAWSRNMAMAELPTSTSDDRLDIEAENTISKMTSTRHYGTSKAAKNSISYMKTEATFVLTVCEG